MSVKRLLDCTPSELARYTKAELLDVLVPVPKSTCILQSGTSAFSCFSHS